MATRVLPSAAREIGALFLNIAITVRSSFRVMFVGLSVPLRPPDHFSNIQFGVIKAWKRHRQMQLNLIIPIGRVKFVLFDDRNGVENSVFQEVILSPENYLRLTIPPLIWVGFQGLAKENSTLLNIASIEHSDEELDRRSLNDINYSWELSK